MGRTSSETITVRKGAPADGAILCELIAALADYEKLPRPTSQAAQRLVRDAYGPQPRFDTWFGLYGGKAVGYAISFYTYSTFLALPTFYLEDLFVLPDYRSMKIGKKIFMHCARVAYEQGCGRMEWQVLHWNEPALQFYNRLGGKPLSEWLPYRATRDELRDMLTTA